MRIGLDLDNTLICYEQVFLAEARSLNLLPDAWVGTKRQIKEELKSRSGGEKLWQMLQGRVYGPCINQAEMYPAVANFLLRCRHGRHEIFIVSHKTEFGHFDMTRTPLRQAALSWMTRNGFFDSNRFDISQKNVFFLGTRKGKVSRIGELELDVFIDDLAEVFEEDGFPPITKILFGDSRRESEIGHTFDSWSEIGECLLGPISIGEVFDLAQQVAPEEVDEIQPVRGQGNSRVYCLKGVGGDKFALKCYPDLAIDPRPRLRTEVNACRLLQPYKVAPTVGRYDEELNVAVFEWISGESPVLPEVETISQGLSFIRRLKCMHDLLGGETPEASEACLSGKELFEQIERRLEQLDLVHEPTLVAFLASVLKPLWAQVKERGEAQWPSQDMEERLGQQKQTLSPSDFGFHNAIRRKDGTLCFLDLEYFGRDDPVKLIADFLWHPAMELSVSQKRQWLSGMLTIFGDDQELESRFMAAWPVYGIRWALILLNEFREDGWRKRVHAQQEIHGTRLDRTNRQLVKASAVCASINQSSFECPYV